jgi:serine/threonine protein phosphatase 1
MSTIAVGDIHGNLAALDDLLRQLRAEVDEHDTVVFLGDYIDRGPDSKGCVDAILDFQREAVVEVVCLRGNHEDWFFRTLCDYRRHSWLLGMEGLATVQSYSPDAAAALREAVEMTGLSLYLSHPALPYDLFFKKVPEAHLQFFESLVPFYQSSDCICVHGGLDQRIARMEDQPVDALIWGAHGFPDQYSGPNTVVYGHWNNADVDASGWPMPRIVGRTIGLDTIAHGVLTALRLPDGRLFQSARHTIP